MYFKKKEDYKMLSIFDVAKFFVLKEEALSNKKIQKLCYYAQGWYLGLKGIPFFNEDFEAWVHGPVCSDLYKGIRYSGTLEKGDLNHLTDADKIFLKAIYEEYGKYSGLELSEMTHNEPPWKITRGDTVWHENSNKIIEKKIIKDYFEEIARES